MVIIHRGYNLYLGILTLFVLFLTVVPVSAGTFTVPIDHGAFVAEINIMNQLPGLNEHTIVAVGTTITITHRGGTQPISCSYGTLTLNSTVSHTFTTKGTEAVTFQNPYPRAYNMWFDVVDSSAFPNATLSVNPSSGDIPLTVSAVVTSTGSPTSYSFWVQNPSGSIFGPVTQSSNTYTTQLGSPGTWIIRASSKNSYGTSPTVSSSVVASMAKPHASFIATPEMGQPPLNVAFHDTSTGYGITYFEWNYGNGVSYGGNYSAQVDSSTTYDALGTYTVSLTVGNSAGSDTATKTITVAKAPYTLTPTPTQTIQTIPPTVVPTTAPIQTLTTLVNTSPTLINRQAVKDQINGTVIAPVLVPYTNLVDGVGNSTEVFGVGVTKTLATPLISVTHLASTALTTFRGAIMAFVIPSHFFMIFMAAMVQSLPELGQDLILVALSCTSAYLILRGRVGNG